ncbi:cytochrome P450 [Peniophora sp. CONT]|nr:cytochrome P450 [Peniophora sp. CONT]
MIGQILSAFAAIIVVFAGKDLYQLIQGSLRPFFSPLRLVPGPPSDGFLLGNLRAIVEADPCTLHEKWAKEYGPVVKYKMFLNRDMLSIMDTRAVAHILGHPMDYQKPTFIRRALTAMLGNGLLTVEGERHKHQRRVMSPAFGIPHIRELTSIFISKSLQLRDIWASKLQEKQLEVNPDDPSAGKIEVLSWLNKMTLDVIGLAGFNHNFNALSPNEDAHELNQALRTLLSNDAPSVLDILHLLVPATRILKSKRDIAMKHARATLDRVGKQFLDERKSAVLAAAESKVERRDIVGKDLLSVLIRNNMASDIPEEDCMTDDEVLAQVPTFLLAGHETTSTAVTWSLFALAQNQVAQDQLREEARACHDQEEPSMETLDALPYLDCVVRETMRLFSPIASTLRVAMKDDVIPAAKEWVDNKGARRSGVRVCKGDFVFLPFLALSRSEAIWGDDAHEWKPERWSKGIPAAASVPGIWGNSFAFSGGSRACIGYRFSVIEMKAIIYTLIRAFRFSMSVDPSEIKFKSSDVTRPHLKDKVDEGPQLPLWVSIVDSEAHVA